VNLLWLWLCRVSWTCNTAVIIQPVDAKDDILYTRLNSKPNISHYWCNVLNSCGFTMEFLTKRLWIWTLYLELLSAWTCSSSGIPLNRKHSVSETGSVSVLRWGDGDTYSVGSIRKSRPQSMVQWALSKGHHKVKCLYPFSWGRKRIQFPNVCVFY
jgi:hypothetical protein